MFARLSPPPFFVNLPGTTAPLRSQLRLIGLRSTWTTSLMAALLLLTTSSAAQPLPAVKPTATPLTAPPQATTANVKPSEPVVNSALNASLFYQLLLGELNVRLGEAGTGYSRILDAARQQKDPQLYRRAVEVALQARSGEAALAAARTWAQALPSSAEPQRFVLQILLALNRVGETPPVLRSLVERGTVRERNDAIHVLPQSYARTSDKAAALNAVREGLVSAMRQPDTAAAAWTTLGRMQLASDQPTEALASAKAGHGVDPASPFPALLALELMERGHMQGESVVRQYLSTAPPTPDDGPNIALVYARTLLDLQRFDQARELLDQLTKQQANLPEPWLLLGTLQVQNNAWMQATRSLENFMALASQSEDENIQRGLTQAYLLMAQIAEKQQDFAAASGWLDRIENGSNILAAQMRRASLLARQGQLDDARALLRNQPERRPGDARLKLAAEAQLLREQKAWAQAYELYTQATARFPDDTELLYEQAMMAEKTGRLDEMEGLLRQLIERQPDHHHAYNALGYSLADRGLRLDEAKALIEKAVTLAPDDAYIQDSLGWVEFRLGNRARALEVLKLAYTRRPDAEIAAHLGEVLWTSGQREQALKIWREGLLLANDNETLQSTLQRLRVKP